jgi:hypothetical protein
MAGGQQGGVDRDVRPRRRAGNKGKQPKAKTNHEGMGRVTHGDGV